jgi:signal transduction histidine kinase
LDASAIIREALARECRVLVLAPSAWHSSGECRVLENAGLRLCLCSDAEHFCAEYQDGAGAGLLVDGALSDAAIELLARCIAEQPAWSDLPLLILRNPAAPPAQVGTVTSSRLEPLRNYIILDTPVSATTLASCAKAALRARAAQYHHRDRLREAQLHQQEIEARMHELARSNTDLQQFAYVYSHDLKEPLRTITSYAQLLDQRYRERLDGDAHEFLGFIVDAARRMGILIQDLLSYSRVINAEEAVIEPLQLDGTFEWARMNLDRTITETAAKVARDPLPTVPGNQPQLALLFQNLLSNALKFRQPGRSPEVYVSVARQGDEWRIGVRDNGPGIDPQYHDRIFGLFKRLHGRDIPGTGMGLAICRRIVERHGGRIWVESKAGEGATFFFTLPALPGA